MKIEITHTYKFEINDTEIILTQDQARELYLELRKEFGDHITFNPGYKPLESYKQFEMPSPGMMPKQPSEIYK